jgi:hypothetical protein
VPGFVNYKKGCTQLAAASDKVYQLLVHGRWFSLGTPASSTTKTGRHDIAESGIKYNESNQIILYLFVFLFFSKLNLNTTRRATIFTSILSFSHS